jgi:pentatricopeptide repeat protein
MRAQAVPLSTYSCNVLADACIRCGQPQRALRLYRDYENARDAPKSDEPARELDVRSFNIMLKAHREMGQLEGALGTLAALKVRWGCCFFFVLVVGGGCLSLTHICKLNRLFHTTTILLLFQARGLEPDVVTYNTLVDAYCKGQKPQGARALIGEMAAKGLPVTHQTLHPLLQEEITSQALPLDAALALADSLLGGYGLRPSHVTVCTVMEAMLAMERPAEAVATFLRSYTEGASMSGCVCISSSPP